MKGLDVASEREGGGRVLVEAVVEGSIGEGWGGSVDNEGEGVLVGREPHGVEGRPMDGANVTGGGAGLELSVCDGEVEGELLLFLDCPLLTGNERLQLALERARVDGDLGGNAGGRHWW